MRLYRLREVLPLRSQSPRGGAKRLPGLQVHSRLRAGSPDRCAASPPGSFATPHSVPRGRRKRLPGLRVHSRLRAGSPDRCAASPPGKARAMSLVFTQITQQKGNTLPGHRLFEGDFDNDRQRYRKQHPYRTQQPAPENQRQEDHQRR